MKKTDPRRPTRKLLTKETLTILYYWEGYTMEEIGKMFGITKERVRQIMQENGLKRFERAKK